MKRDESSGSNGKIEFREDVICGLIETISLPFFSILAKYFWQEYNEIFPEIKMICICLLVTLVAFFILYFMIEYSMVKVKWLNYGCMILLYLMLFVMLLRFMTILVILNQNSEEEMLLVAIRNEVFLFLITWDIGILYIFFHKKYIESCNENNIVRTEKSISKVITKESKDVVKKVEAYSSNIEEVLKKMDFDTAVTSTIIPFSYDPKKGEIKTYLIANYSYPEYTWMFPGGHVAFSEDQSPGTIAVSRAKDEANLIVSITDVNDTFAGLALEDNQVSNMTIFEPPHFLYLFKLDERAKCFKDKGHEYHLDVVYIAEVNKEERVTGNQKRITITLSANITSLDEINNKCHMATREYYRKHSVKNAERKNVPDYVETMLYNAFVAYKKSKGI